MSEENTKMLGLIANEVGEWCSHSECTTLDAVKLLKAEVFELRGYKIRTEIYSTIRDH